jgi:hypothetical protein
LGFKDVVMQKVFDVVVRVTEYGELVHVYQFVPSGSAANEWVEKVRSTSKGTDRFFILRGLTMEGLDANVVKVEVV